MISDALAGPCLFGTTAIMNVFSSGNVTIVEWIQMSQSPDQAEIARAVNVLQQIGRSILASSHSYN